MTHAVRCARLARHEPAGSRQRPQQRRGRGRQRRHRRRLGPAFRRNARAAFRASRPPIRPARAQPHRLLQGWRRKRRRCCSSMAATGRRGPRRSFRCLPAGPMAHGINVALIGYTLAPDATLDEIVAEIHAGSISWPSNCPRSAATRTGSWFPDGRPAGISRRWRCRTRRSKAAWRSAASTILSRSATAISTSSSASMKRCLIATHR